MTEARRNSGGPLSTYRRMRRFEETPEPPGRRVRRRGHSYVIQKHAARRLHYDFRLELDGVLKSWAVTRGPSLDPSQKRLAVRTEDHPVEYGGFEGTIPKGQYGGGTVMLWDRGSWEPIGDPHQGLERGKLVFRLFGERLRGRWALVRFKGGARGDGNRENWLLVKELDDEVDRSGDILDTYGTSVTTGRDLDAIAAGRKPAKAEQPLKVGSKAANRPKRRGAKLPDFIEPALATLVDAVPTGEGWLFEMKFDGYRALLAVSGDEACVFTRNGHDWTDRFAAIAAAAAELGLDGALIDGEVAVLDEKGRSDFSALQRSLKGEGGEMLYFAFDLLVERGKDLRRLELAERKSRLKAVLGEAGRKGPILYSDHVEGGGEAMLAELCRRGFEGVIAKRAGAPYRSGRGRDWLKVKCGNQQEFVIVGWSPSTRNRPFSSILLGLREGRSLRYVGRVGSGFSESDLADLAKRFARLARPTPAVEGEIPPSQRRRARWVEPRLVAEIAFAGFTHDGAVRQGRFLGLREDKGARQVKRERAKPLREAAMAKSATADGKSSNGTGADSTVAGVRLSNPDKLLYKDQGLTKRDMARYLERVAPVMLPHVADRLISLVRCPDGRIEQCFFQRHIGAALPPTFHRLRVKESDGETEEYIYISDKAGLVGAAQVGALELHIWGSHIDDVERPDRLAFDLDPGEGVEFEEVKRAAEDMRHTLAALGLKSFPMLTGGKGVHVVVPMACRYDWPVVKMFCRSVAEQLAAAAPDRFVATMSKAKRRGRIFLDYLRNDRTSTAIAPFSPRARPGAPVAWPVEWTDLPDLETAAAVTVADVLSGERKPVSWKRYGLRQQIKRSALSALGIKEP